MGELAKGAVGFQNQLQVGPTVIQQSSQGLFVYSGTPAAGNLLLAIAAVAGADAFGNSYLAGLSIEHSGFLGVLNSLTDYIKLYDGGLGPILTFNPNSAAFQDGVIQAYDTGAGGGGTEVHTQLGFSGPISMGALVPQINVVSNTTTSNMTISTATLELAATIVAQFSNDININGNIIKSSGAAYTPYTWQTPSYGTNWSGSTSFNGNAVRTLKYRLDAQDNVVFQGCFAAGATVPANPVFNVPVPYRPANAMTMTVWKNAGGTLSQGLLYIATSGNVDLFTTLGNSITASAQWIVNGRIPLDLIA